MPVPMIDPAQIRMQTGDRSVSRPKMQTAADFRTFMSASQPGTVTGLQVAGLPKEASITNAAIVGSTNALSGAGVPYGMGMGSEIAPGSGVTQFDLIEKMRMTNMELIGLQASVQNVSLQTETIASINKAKFDAANFTIQSIK